MATVRKRGNTYQIRVSCGYDVLGKHIEKTMTWKPKQGMTQKQIDKELNRQAVMFEEKCMTGQFLDGNITFAEFTERWFRDYAEKQLKAKTINGYKYMLPRLTAAIGHIKLCRLQPHHLMEFYNNLGEKGIRLDTKYKPCSDFKDKITAAGYTQKSLSETVNISVNTVGVCCNGHNVAKTTADKISSVIKCKGLFEAVNADKCLSDKTISEYHRFISSILTTAVQWQVIPSNPCQRVKPPKVKQKEAQALDEKEVSELLQCLENEPLKYKTAIMMLLYTGMRRGELCGLNWSDIDLENGIVNIDKAILYLPDRGIYEDSLKTKQSKRIIRIPKDMVDLLNQYRIYQLENKLILGDKWRESKKVFTTDYGSVIHPDTLSKWFKKFIKRHNLPNVHIHSLRHTAATLLIASGVDIATVSKRLGHSKKSTTLDIYTHAVKSADAVAAEVLQNVFVKSRIN